MNSINFRDATKGILAARASKQEPVYGKALTGSGEELAQTITYTFPYQSYLDDALGARALNPQSLNDMIVNDRYTKMMSSLASGYAVGLHPSSETPIAIRFKKGEQGGDSPVHFLKPGEVIRPMGMAEGGGKFSGFDWGIPFGWLGGGTATLFVLRAADADVEWATLTEVLFHRLRLQILAPAAFNPVPADPGFANWPMKFPWEYAVSAQGGFVRPQGTYAAFSVNPTRVEMRLRKSADLPNAATMRVLQYLSEPFDQDAVGITGPTLADVMGTDVTWGQWTNLVLGSGSPQLQVQQFVSNNSFAKLPSYVGGIALVSSDPELIGEYVDILRYGML